MKGAHDSHGYQQWDEVQMDIVSAWLTETDRRGKWGYLNRDERHAGAWPHKIQDWPWDVVTAVMVMHKYPILIERLLVWFYLNGCEPNEAQRWIMAKTIDELGWCTPSAQTPLMWAHGNKVVNDLMAGRIQKYCRPGAIYYDMKLRRPARCDGVGKPE